MWGMRRKKTDKNQNSASGNDENSDREENPVKPSLDPLYQLAQRVAEVLENIATPGELKELDVFQSGVRYLSDPGFTCEDLLAYAQGDNEPLSHMALVALEKCEPFARVRRDLLAVMDRVSVWRRYFILGALAHHVPATEPLAGEICIVNRELHTPYAKMFHGFLEPWLEQRLAGGEVLTFGKLLDGMDGEGVAELEGFLKLGPTELLADLIAEVENWQSSFVDRDLLRGAGKLWGENGLGVRSVVIEHPRLNEQVATIEKALNQSPCRSTLIIGEAGSGKTALMQAVGRRLLQKGRVIFQAGGRDLVAGQSYIGEFENQLKKIVAQLSGQRQAVWYVPDFDSLQMAGRHSFSREGALDLLLPLIEAGQLVMIGEILPTAFEKLVQNHPRLLSAFDLCRLETLDESATLDVARRWIEASSPAEGPPLVSEEVLQEAWLLTGQYRQDRAAPGNLLDFLKLGLLRLSEGQDHSATLAMDDLIATLSRLTGLPAAILDDRHRLDTTDLRGFFQQRIKGQPEAIDCVVDRIGIIKAGLADPTRPLGVFLFAGPTGTGKTEIAKTLAAYLFGSVHRLIRLDMSEFQQAGELQRLTGSGEPGDAQSLAAQVRKQPFSVILLDEFEKAHPRVWDMFLQVFDDGRLTDSQGRTTDFRHTIILLTSNLGSHAPSGESVGFQQSGRTFRTSEVDKAIAQTFRREFLNRLDRVVIFRPLDRETMRSILVRELENLQTRRGLRNRNWEVVWEESATDFLLDRGFSPDMGARPLKRAVEKHLVTPLAETIVKGQFPSGDQFLYIHAAGDRLKVEFVDPHVPEEADEAAESATPALLELDAPGTVLSGSPAGIALSATGSDEELELLRACLGDLRSRLESPAWTEAKNLALSMMGMPDFWDSEDRFAIMGEVEYRERVERGLDTAETLLKKMVSGRIEGAQGYSRPLARQVAERLILLEQACAALEQGEPWEALVTLEARTETGLTGAADRRWLTRLRDMYLNWAGARKAQTHVLQDLKDGARDCRPVLMAFSGFAAYGLLRQEEGLHVWEAPSSREKKAFDHQQVLVRVAPQPAELGGVPGADPTPAARELLVRPLAGAPAIVRHYREQPDPLVKDRIRNWRTGRLDRVLAGHFDLLGLHATADAAQETDAEG